MGNEDLTSAKALPESLAIAMKRYDHIVQRLESNQVHSVSIKVTGHGLETVLNDSIKIEHSLLPQDPEQPPVNQDSHPLEDEFKGKLCKFKSHFWDYCMSYGPGTQLESLLLSDLSWLSKELSVCVSDVTYATPNRREEIYRTVNKFVYYLKPVVFCHIEGVL